MFQPVRSLLAAALLLSLALLVAACAEPTPTSVPTPTPTPVVWPDPPKCPPQYERDQPGYGPLSEEEALTFQPNLYGPGITLVEALCERLLQKTAERRHTFDEWHRDEIDAARALGMELAQETPDEEAVRNAVQRWYRTLDSIGEDPEEVSLRENAVVEVRFSYVDVDEPRIWVTASDREGAKRLGWLLSKRYGDWPVSFPAQGATVVCPIWEVKELLERAPGSAAARGLGVEPPDWRKLYCAPLGVG